MVAFGNPPYNLVRLFRDKEIDGVYVLEESTSSPLIESNLNTWGYKEAIPVSTFCIDKPGITGTKLKWKMEATEV